MLAKNHRLTRSEFWQVSQSGKQFSTEFTVVKYLNNHLSFARWAVVTSAKMSKKASVRNSLRRKIFQLLQDLKPDSSTDVVIFPRASMLNLSDAQLSHEIDQVVSKISSLA